MKPKKDNDNLAKNQNKNRRMLLSSKFYLQKLF